MEGSSKSLSWREDLNEVEKLPIEPPWKVQRKSVSKDLAYYTPDDVFEIECISTIEKLWTLYFSAEPTNLDESDYLIEMRTAVLQRWVSLHQRERCLCGDSDCRTSCILSFYWLMQHLNI